MASSRGQPQLYARAHLAEDGDVERANERHDLHPADERDAKVGAGEVARDVREGAANTRGATGGVRVKS